MGTSASVRPSRLTLAAFAAPSLPISALGLPLLVYLPEYYVSQVGLSLAFVGLAFMIVRLADIVVDPVLGALMDRTRTPYGRFRVWLAAGVPVLVAGVFTLFMAEPGASPGRLVAGLLITYLGYSICALAHMALGAGLATRSHERSSVYAWWQGGNIVGNIVVLTVPPVAMQMLVLDRGSAVQAMGWFVCIAAPLAIALAVWRVPETPAATSGRHPRIADYWRLMGVANVRRLLVCDLLLGMAPGFAGSLFLLFFQLARGFSKVEASLLLLAYFIGGLSGAPIWTRLSRRFGKPRALSLSLLFYALCQAWWIVMPHGQLAAGLAALFVAGLPFSAGALLLRSMMADVADEVRLETGNDRTGLLYALLTGTQKVAHAISVGVTFTILEHVGFDPATATQEGITWLSLLYIGPPAAFVLVAAWAIERFSLDAERHARIVATLATQRATA